MACLSAHNFWRNRHIDTANLVWNSTLYESAKVHATLLANTNTLVHSDLSNVDIGESLAFLGGVDHNLTDICNKTVRLWLVFFFIILQIKTLYIY